MEYMTVRQAAEKWGCSVRWIQILCEDSRIPGVVRPGRDWMIPKDAKKPADARIRSGKYKKAQAAERRDTDEESE